MYARSGSGILHLAFPVHNVFFCLLFKRALPRSTSFRVFCQRRFAAFLAVPGLQSKELCWVRRHSGLAFKRALPRSTSFRACIQKSFDAFNVIPGLHSKELCRVRRHSGLAFKRALPRSTSFHVCYSKELCCV